MKKFKLLIISVLLTFLFTGCDSVVFTQVKMSELLNNEEKNALRPVIAKKSTDFRELKSRIPVLKLIAIFQINM